MYEDIVFVDEKLESVLNLFKEIGEVCQEISDLDPFVGYDPELNPPEDISWDRVGKYQQELLSLQARLHEKTGERNPVKVLEWIAKEYKESNEKKSAWIKEKVDVKAELRRRIDALTDEQELALLEDLPEVPLGVS